MAFTLAALELNAEVPAALRFPTTLLGQYALGAVVFPPAQLGQFALGGVRFPLPTISALTDGYLQISLPTLTEAGPISTTYTVGGGAKITGEAPRDFYLNGVWEIDPARHTITPTGGAQVTGTAPFSAYLTIHPQIVGTGGSKAGSTAPISTNWTQYTMQGGGKAGGSATIATSLVGSSGIATTLPVITAALSGVGPLPFEVDADLPVITAGIDALLGTDGAVSTTLPVLSATLAGGQFGVGVTLTVPAVTLAGVAGNSGGIDAQLPRLGADIAATSTIAGGMDVRLPLVRADATALLGAVAQISTLLPHLRESFEGSAGAAGTLSVTLTKVSAELDGYTNVLGAMSVVLPSMTAELRAEIALTLVQVLCMNANTSALAEYTAYPYNSFCEFNGMYLAASSDGLYQVEDGDTDNGVAIDASFETGDNDFNNEYQKRLTDFYIGMRADGDLALTVTTDEGDPVEYTLETYGVERLKQRRVITAKGAKGKYWRFKIANTDGCDFEIDTMNIAAVPLARRI